MVLITPSIEPDGALKVKFPENSDCDEFSILLNPTEQTLKSWSMYALTSYSTTLSIDQNFIQPPEGDFMANTRPSGWLHLRINYWSQRRAIHDPIQVFRETSPPHL